MKKFFAGLFLFISIGFMFGINHKCFAAPEIPNVPQPQAVDQQGDDLDSDLLNPTSPTNPQPNGSDIQPEKRYKQADYEQIYREMEVPTFSFIHGVDPDQYYDMKNSAWSPYPLMRLNSPLYFKSITILPGYYLLTPREYKGDWYLLFKEAGKVKYIIPVFDKSYTPEMYYKNTLPEVKMKKTKRWTVRFLDSVGKSNKHSKRQPATQANLELTDLDNSFLLMELYYGPMKYKSILRTDKF